MSRDDNARRALTVYSTALASLMRRLGIEETVIERDEMQPLEWLEITGIERDEQGDLVRMRVQRRPAEPGGTRRELVHDVEIVAEPRLARDGRLVRPADRRLDGRDFEIPTPEERDFFEACGVPWAEPEQRG